MKRYTLIAAAAIACAPAHAGQFNVTDQSIVELVTGWGAEGLYVLTAGTVPAGASCGSGNYFMLELGHPMQREIVAMLMTAQQSKARINIFVDGCVGGAMKLKAVTVKS